MAGTLQDIADAAGVSIATVSLVLNGKEGISAETRQKVMQAAEALNYRPKKQQSLMSANSRNTIQFLKIAMHGHTVNRDHNVFISDYIDGMFREAQRQGYKLEIANIKGESIDYIIDSLFQETGRRYSSRN
jgi:Transcriptional regulators